jgi:hypothetical protein
MIDEGLIGKELSWHLLGVAEKKHDEQIQTKSILNVNLRMLLLYQSAQCTRYMNVQGERKVEHHNSLILFISVDTCVGLL